MGTFWPEQSDLNRRSILVKANRYTSFLVQSKLSVKVIGKFSVYPKDSILSQPQYWHGAHATTYLTLPSAYLCRFRCYCSSLDSGFGLPVSVSALPDSKDSPFSGQQSLGEREGKEPPQLLDKRVLTENETCAGLPSVWPSRQKVGKIIPFSPATFHFLFFSFIYFSS